MGRVYVCVIFVFVLEWSRLFITSSDSDYFVLSISLLLNLNYLIEVYRRLADYRKLKQGTRIYKIVSS